MIKDLPPLRITILWEHGDHSVEHYQRLCFISGSDLNEHVLGGEPNLGVVAIDDGREGEDDAISVVDDRVDGRVFDDVKIRFEMRVSAL